MALTASNNYKDILDTEDIGEFGAAKTLKITSIKYIERPNKYTNSLEKKALIEFGDKIYFTSYETSINLLLYYGGDYSIDLIGKNVKLAVTYIDENKLGIVFVLPISITAKLYNK